MSAVSNALTGGSDQGLSAILAQLNSLLTPTEQLPGNQSPSVLLTGGSVAPASRPAMPSSGTAAGDASSSGSSLSSLLNNSSVRSALSNLLGGTSLAAYASGAPADSAVSAALGSVGSQTAPTAASIQAGNDAALSAANGGAYGAGAGLLSTGALSSGLAADTAVTGALGSVGAQTAGEAAAIQAANDAALGGAASSGATGGAAASGAPAALSSAGYALAGPAAFAAMYGLGNEFNSMLTGQNNNYSIGQINDMLAGVKQNAASTLTPAMASGPAGSLNFTNPNGSPNSSLYNAMTQLNQMQLGDFGLATPYVQQQLAGMGFKPVLGAMQGSAAGPAYGPGRFVQKV